MATAAKCGLSGSVSLGGEITSWDLILEEDIPEATSMESKGMREYIPCLKSASGNYTSLTAAGVIGSQTSVDFVNDIETVTCDIIITDINILDPVDNKVEYKYTWVSTGPISIH
jgi:hypothetical protein